MTWDKYFRLNIDHFDHLDWTDKRPLSGKERHTINFSIRQFQRGEHSEGKHFLQFAKSFNDPHYISALRRFIKEEQDHAAVLGRYMEIHEIPKLSKDRLDSIFRWLRKLAGLEGTLTVLLTAEIISMVYYKALENATASPLLQQISRQILVDEEMHLRFQCATLQVLYKRKSLLSFVLSRTIHNILLSGTLLMVWFYHQKVFRAGGFHLFAYLNESWNVFRNCKKMISNQSPAVPVFKLVNKPVVENHANNSVQQIKITL
jgi:hypothetical protein